MDLLCENIPSIYYVQNHSAITAGLFKGVYDEEHLLDLHKFRSVRTFIQPSGYKFPWGTLLGGHCIVSTQHD